MQEITDKIITTDINKLKNIKFNADEKTGLIIKFHGQNYEFIVNMKDKHYKNIVICPEKAEFTNIGLMNLMELNTILFKEPTKNYGWRQLIGTPQVWHMENIAEIIKIISGNITNYDGCQNPYENLYYYGLSNASFMAMALSLLTENSTSIIDKPIFDLTHTGLWKNIKASSFKDVASNEIIKYSYRYKITDLIKNKKTIPNTYITLETDNHDAWKTQYHDFLDKVESLPYNSNMDDNRINIQLGKTFHDNNDNTNEIIAKINQVIHITEQEKTLNNVKYQIIQNMKEEINDIYTRYNNNEIDYEEFIKSKNTYIKQYRYARVDMKNTGKKDNQIEITDQEKEYYITTPEWFKNDKGEGTTIITDKKTIKLTLKTIKNGKLNINLKGQSYLNIDNKRKPVHIIYQKLLINNSTIFNKNIPAWHNQPYTYEKTCTNNETVKIEIEYRTIYDYYPYLEELLKQLDADEKQLTTNYSILKNYMNYLEMINGE